MTVLHGALDQVLWAWMFHVKHRRKRRVTTR